MNWILDTPIDNIIIDSESCHHKDRVLTGTTGVSCVNLNRQFIGIEQSQEYYDIATARINDTEYQPEAKTEQTKLW